MNRYVPIEKQSKKQQREYYKKRRKDWGGLSPVTRCPEDTKKYNRAKAKAAAKKAAKSGGSLPYSLLFPAGQIGNKRFFY